MPAPLFLNNSSSRWTWADAIRMCNPLNGTQSSQTVFCHENGRRGGGQEGRWGELGAWKRSRDIKLLTSLAAWLKPVTHGEKDGRQRKQSTCEKRTPTKWFIMHLTPFTESETTILDVGGASKNKCSALGVVELFIWSFYLYLGAACHLWMLFVLRWWQLLPHLVSREQLLLSFVLPGVIAGPAIGRLG